MGWLGLPLAYRLQALGYKIKGSVTSVEKAALLREEGFSSFPLELSESGVTGNPEGLLQDTDILLIMIPPGLRRNTGTDYLQKMVHFIAHIKKSNVSKVVFVSSISVYGDTQGKVTERDIPMPEHRAGNQLLQVERLLFSSEAFKTTIVRFGGLFGGSRQPVRYLAGRTELSGGTAPVNLIHRDDCIGILSEIIKQDAFGYIFHGVLPQHPVKKEYYTRTALALQLQPPHFSEAKETKAFKQVDSEQLQKLLGYSFERQL